MPQAYENAGVSVEAGYEVVKRIKSHVARTNRPGVVGGIGGFGGLFDLASLGYKEPVLISGTDGVGTKLVVAKMVDKHDTIGIDCVAMCVNDIAAQGAEPLFFLDYIACGKNDPALLEQVVPAWPTDACRSEAGLIGGETAEMPGMYDEDEYDLAGFAVGVAEKVRHRRRLRHHRRRRAHRTAIHRRALQRLLPRAQGSVRAGRLYRRHRAPRTRRSQARRRAAHPRPRSTSRHSSPCSRQASSRASPTSPAAVSSRTSPRMIPRRPRRRHHARILPVLPIFDVLERAGDIDHKEMYNIFNMGIGMALAVSAERADETLALLKDNGEAGYAIGTIVPDTDGTQITLK